MEIRIKFAEMTLCRTKMIIEVVGNVYPFIEDTIQDLQLLCRLNYSHLDKKDAAHQSFMDCVLGSLCNIQFVNIRK